MIGDEGRGTRLVAIRGAIDVASDTPEDVKRAVSHLVRQMDTRNALTQEDIISAHFTMTPDLRSAFPAAAAREAGWSHVPMLCSTAIDVPGALPRCIRVLMHASIAAGRRVEHVYLGRAVTLRPDLSKARE